MEEVQIEEYPSNKKITKKVNAKIKKKSFWSDNLKEVGIYILIDVLIPAAKSTISDIITNGIEMILYGEPRRRRDRRDDHKTYVSYSSFYGERREKDKERRSSSTGKTKLSNIVFDTRPEAEEALSSLVEIIEVYGAASVSDFYDLIGFRSDYTDNKYGWVNLRDSNIVRDRDGFVIEFPKPEVLD